MAGDPFFCTTLAGGPMSYPDPPQQPQWQPPQQPGQAFPPPQGPQQGFPQGPGQPGPPFPGGPQGPGQPPYGGQYQGAPMPPGGDGRGGGRKWLIPAAAVTAVVLMAGTVWATVSLVSFGGPQPESVLPGNSVAFAKADLDIDGSQAMDLLRFVEKLPDEVSEEIGDVDEDDTSAPFAEAFAESYDLDPSAVEGWIGQKVGAASWITDNPEFESSEGATYAIALAVNDAGAAEEQFTDLTQSHDVEYTMVDDFVVFTDQPGGIADYNDQMSTNGDLESDDTYSGDLDGVASGSIALAWADLGALGQISTIEQELASELGSAGSLQGRMTASFRVTGDYLEARMDVFGFEVEGTDVSWLAEGSGASLDAIGGLPENTTVALGGSGLDQMLGTAWENDELPFLDEQDRQSMETEMNSIGAPLPEGFTSLLGGSTAVGLSDFDMGGMNGPGAAADPTVVFRAVGGDATALNSFVDEIVANPYSSVPAPTVTEDGDTVVVTSGDAGGGVLADDEVFQQTMADMDDAVMAGYVDMRQAVTRDDVQAPEQWGAVGVGLSVAEGGERAVFELRWAPSGA
ncbi:hypothetical protein [Nocardiopsis sp. JB363]|uniref:hypothetical protein n=1 Tax=Nocardiopsis sp. JB363 TaxID=1434837 RepID=UPI0035138CB6